jgi:hypothetical protein
MQSDLKPVLVIMAMTAFAGVMGKALSKTTVIHHAGNFLERLKSDALVITHDLARLVKGAPDSAPR